MDVKYLPVNYVYCFTVSSTTDPSRYLFVYHEYTLLGTYNASLTIFLNMFHSLPIWVTFGSDTAGYRPSVSALKPGHNC